MPVYDSRLFVKRLTEVGMPEGEADVLANENLHLLAEHLSTKEDLLSVGTGLQGEIDKLRVEMHAELDKLRMEMHAELDKLRMEMRAEIDKLRVEMQAELEKLRMEMHVESAALENRLLLKLTAILTALFTIFNFL